jgi:hypothetical protein
MLLYEVVIATGIAVVLVVAVIGGLVARVMMGSEEAVAGCAPDARRPGRFNAQDRVMSCPRPRAARSWRG